MYMLLILYMLLFMHMLLAAQLIAWRGCPILSRIRVLMPPGKTV